MREDLGSPVKARAFEMTPRFSGLRRAGFGLSFTVIPRGHYTTGSPFFRSGKA